MNARPVITGPLHRSTDVISGHSTNSAQEAAVGQVIRRRRTRRKHLHRSDHHPAGPRRANSTSAEMAIVAGGESNQATNMHATVSGGYGNTASGNGSTVSGGIANRSAGTHATVAGGLRNHADGGYSTVAGGAFNDATGSHSFAAGYRAKALASGAFTFGDSTDADVTGNVANALVMAFSGGIGLYTNKAKTSGCTVSSAGNLSCTGTIAGAGAGGDITGVATGAGLSGGGTSGDVTLSIASGGVTAAMLAGNGCTNGQILKYNGSGWACAADLNGGGGGVTAVTASAPLASSGGAAPNITLTGAVPVANGGTGLTSLPTNGVVYGQGTGAIAAAVGSVGQVLAGTSGAPAWTNSPTLLGNLNLWVTTDPSVGVITKSGGRFIHNFGVDSTYIGLAAGNFAASGFGNNTGIGASSLANLQNGAYNTSVGSFSLALNTTGSNNTASGTYSLRSTRPGPGTPPTATPRCTPTPSATTTQRSATAHSGTTRRRTTTRPSAGGPVHAVLHRCQPRLPHQQHRGRVPSPVQQPARTAQLRDRQEQHGRRHGGAFLQYGWDQQHRARPTGVAGQSNRKLDTALGNGAGRAITGSNNIVIGAGAGDGLDSGNYNIVIGHPGTPTRPT